MPIMTQDRLYAFAAAWADRDLEKVLSFFTEECVYKASVGIEPGTTYRGKALVAKGIEQMWRFDKAEYSEVHGLVLYGRYGFWEWTHHSMGGACTKGCDFFTFQGDLIQEKNAFRKINTSSVNRNGHD